MIHIVGDAYCDWASTQTVVSWIGIQWGVTGLRGGGFGKGRFLNVKKQRIVNPLTYSPQKIKAFPLSFWKVDLN